MIELEKEMLAKLEHVHQVLHALKFPTSIEIHVHNDISREDQALLDAFESRMARSAKKLSRLDARTPKV